MNKKIVLITGASSGIGKACAEYLQMKDFEVFGTTRNLSADSIKGKCSSFTSIYMDVTDRISITEAISSIIKIAGRIDILINNAGMGLGGAIEDTSYDELKIQFDTNVLGSLSVINEVLPIMRKQGSGLIINIGSVAGFISIPYQAAYSASKAAMIAFTLALRNEIRQFGLMASIVNPGDTKTKFTDNRRMTVKSTKTSPYEIRMKKSIAVMEKDERNGADPVDVAKVLYKVIKRKNPPVSVTVGFKYKIIALLFRIVPAKLREFFISKLYS